MSLISTPIPESKPKGIEPVIPLRGVSWQTYKALMAEVGDDRGWRIAYELGVLELRMPLLKHEAPKRLLENFIETVADELEIEILEAGALTLEREDLSRAIEPDSCFYVQNEQRVRGKEEIKLPDDPPPDLAIESDYTSSSLNKLSIYAFLGVPELWRYHKGKLLIYQLVNGNYQLSESSLTFPCLPVAEIVPLIEQSKEIGQRAVVRLFRKRIREILLTK
ncbi:MAG: Uma2 family endonuclease [Symploca sp. SIO3E6]|nr:Uma2 family endonuclease [Caldora sp. SIO3E6]